MHSEKSRLKMALQKGEKTAKDCGFEVLPVCPFKIAEEAGILVQAKPDTAGGVSGMLVRNGDSFGILYATHIPSEGFQRFSIAHELGHYFLEGHTDYVLPVGENIHTSHAGFASPDIYEREADSFAAGLLMPSFLFKKALGGFKDGMDAVRGMAELCRTSLTATALRYVQSTPCAAAAIVSNNGLIEYAFLSETLLDAPRITLPKKGDSLPDGCLTAEASNSNATKRGKTDLSEWFSGVSVDGWEEVANLGDYGKTLTIISCSKYPDEEELEEEERIAASLTPRFHRR